VIALVRLIVVTILLGVVVACSGGSFPDEARFSGVIAELWRGPDHCDWDGTHFVIIHDDDLPGAEVTNVDVPNAHMFVRDPDEIPEYSYEAQTDSDRPMPDDAEKLGESTDGHIELWYSGSDPDYLYLIKDGSTEAWVRATHWGLCA
jgi:hypothetical protein